MIRALPKQTITLFEKAIGNLLLADGAITQKTLDLVYNDAFFMYNNSNDITTCIIYFSTNGKEYIITGSTKRSPHDEDNLNAGMAVSAKRALLNLNSVLENNA